MHGHYLLAKRIVIIVIVVALVVFAGLYVWKSGYKKGAIDAGQGGNANFLPTY